MLKHDRSKKQVIIKGRRHCELLTRANPKGPHDRSQAIDGSHGEGRVPICENLDHVAHTVGACSG